jgi:hypothetical protein
MFGINFKTFGFGISEACQIDRQSALRPCGISDIRIQAPGTRGLQECFGVSAVSLERNHTVQ